MYRVAMNVAIYRMKISKRGVNLVPLTASINATADTVPDDYEEKWKVLRTQLDKLNLLEKGLVMLYLEGKNYAEIAQIVGISESNVGTKISRIKEKLRTQIAKNYSPWN
jgi:RNA polymerase sigma-70 factor (ECF subfamily)